jgi:hypothetical protein
VLTAIQLPSNEPTVSHSLLACLTNHPQKSILETILKN